MPDVIRIFCRNNMIRFFGSDLFYGRRFGFDWFFKEASDGGRADRECGLDQELGNAFLAHERAEDFKTLDDITNEVGMLIDWNWCLDKRIIIGAFEPGGDSVGINHENAGGLGDGPAVGGHDFEDKLAFDWSVLRTLMGWSSTHTGADKAQDFLELSRFGQGLIAFGSEPDALDGAVGGPGAGVDQGKMDERNDMKDYGFDLPCPNFG